MRLYTDPRKGACASCHQLADTPGDPARSLFTDYGSDAVGAPRNPRAKAAAKPDLGLCERTDATTPTRDPGYCINFRTPSLRNVAVRDALCTTAPSPTCATWSRSTPRAISHRAAGIRRACKFDVTPPSATAARSIENAAPYGAPLTLATRRRSTTRRSTRSSRFSGTLTDARISTRAIAWAEIGFAERSPSREGPGTFQVPVTIPFAPRGIRERSSQ